jgi:hypothetical protein
VSLNAAPVDVAQGLRMHLFEKVHCAVLTSATLSTGGGRGTCRLRRPRSRRTGHPVSRASRPCERAKTFQGLHVRQGLTFLIGRRKAAVYVVNFRLDDSMPRDVLEAWTAERERIILVARQQDRPISEAERDRLDVLYSEKVERYLDAGHGACWMNDPRSPGRWPTRCGTSTASGIGWSRGA